ncbi:hypothetical protein F5888DRAFT_1639110 [Russula emetica]|nr:hypothetical protein F5888DRAFT_1639110 [Russula emetica]
MTYTWPPGPSQGSQPGGTVVNARVTRGHTFLITGIGGGVALLALKLCLALGARMYVTSNSDAKIARAVALCAADGVNYTHIGRVLRQIVIYGTTVTRQAPFTMREVLRNQQLIGLTMGSKADLQAATDFIAQHRIAPVVSRVLDGLENAEEGFGLLARGEHFGKFVIMVDGSSTNAKL